VSPCYEYRDRASSESPEQYGARLAAELEAKIQEIGPKRVIAFVAEPIVGATMGAVPAVPGYFKRIREVCDRHGVLLIADEVMTGFGRTGRKFGHEHFPFHPDVIVGGKGLGGGYVPLGAVTARDDVVDALRGSGFMYFTFTGNDAACAAGAKVLEIVRREQLVERVAAKGPELEARLRDALGDHPAVTEIRGRGFFYGIELTCSRDAVVAEALSRDLWVYPAGSGPVAEAVMVAPPFVIDDTDLDQLVAVLAESIDAVHRGA